MTSRRYRATFYESLPLGADRFLVYIPGTDKRFILSSTANEILHKCGSSRALESHLDRICDSLNGPGLNWSAVREALHDLLHKGLLVEEGRLIPSVNDAPEFDQPITSLAFLTADRVSLLHRSLTSYSENCRSYGREVEIIVMDDSRSEAARGEYLSCLRNMNDDRLIQYGGSNEKISYIRHLMHKGIDPDIARFAILGKFRIETCTIGANRNCVLLDTVGELVLTADDDTICRLVPHPERDDRVHFGAHENPRDAWFYNTRAEVSASVKWQSCDLLGEHERTLGKQLAKIAIQTPANQVDTAKACRHLLNGLQHADAKVVFSMTGMAGDSGAGYAQNLLMSSKQVLEKLSENEAVARRAFASREVLWVARSPTITHNPQCQAAGLGLANNELLAPFFPVGRNEDGVFGTLNLLIPTFFQSHVPVALFHDAQPGRTYAPLPPFPIASLILSLISFTAPAQSRTMQATLRSIGRGLLDIADFPGQEFWDLLFTAVSRRSAEVTRLLHLRSRKMADCSTYLQEQIEQYREHIFACLTSFDACVPYEFSGLPKELARQQTRELVQNAGRLFYAWPDLVEAAHDLKREGIRLTRGVAELS
jgi:hypothetical protein